MSDPVRHHYVPQFYLSAWCRPGGQGDGDRLCVVENHRGKISYNFRTPAAVGYQNHLYSFSEDVPSANRAELETKVFRVLDTKGKDLVTKLQADKRLDAEERGLWSMFLTAMRLRTPDNIALVRDIGGRHIRTELGNGQMEYESMREAGDPETFLEWIEATMPGLLENFSLASVPRLITGEVSRKIDSMKWHSLNFERARHPLLCSDRPCVFTAGIDDVNCVVALPLSPRHAFIAFYPDSPAEAALTRHGPDAIGAALNKNVVTQAKARAFCAGKHDAQRSFFEKYLVGNGSA